MNTLSVFVSIRKKGSKRLFRCLPKQGDYIGAFVFVNGAIKSVKAITPFNRFYSNVLSFGKLEIDEQNALMLLMQLVLFYVSETQRTLYDSFQFFIPNKKLADYLDKHTVELCKQYKLKNLKFYTVEKKKTTR